MKKIKKILAVVLVLTLVLSMSACGNPKPKGTYSNGFITLTFSGKKVTSTVGIGNVDDVISKGTFKMDGTTIECSYESGGYDNFTYNAEDDSIDVFGIVTLEKVK